MSGPAEDLRTGEPNSCQATYCMILYDAINEISHQKKQSHKQQLNSIAVYYLERFRYILNHKLQEKSGTLSNLQIGISEFDSIRQMSFCLMNFCKVPVNIFSFYFIILFYYSVFLIFISLCLYDFMSPAPHMPIYFLSCVQKQGLKLFAINPC